MITLLAWIEARIGVLDLFGPGPTGIGMRLAAEAAVAVIVGVLTYSGVRRLLEKHGAGRSAGAIGIPDAEPAGYSLFHEHPDAVFELDCDCRIVSLNPAAGRMLDRAPGEVAGEGLSAIAAPERVEADLAQLGATLRGQARVFDSIGVTAEGRHIGVQVTSIPRLADGRVAGIYCIVRNVDTERRLHERLAASEARLRAILDHSMDAIFLSDPVEGRLLECNRAAEKLFGRSQAELCQCSREEVFDLEHSDFSAFIRERDDAGQARGILYLIRPDGSRIPVEATTATFRDGRGSLRSSVTLRDISDRLRQERELRTSEQRYRALFEQSADAILLSRPDGTIDRANPAAERMFRCSEAELCRLGREGLVDPEDPGFRSLMQQRQSASQARAQCRMRRADGEWFQADLSVVAFSDEAGTTRTSVAIRDMTELRELYRRVDLLATAFRSANEALLVCDPELRVLDANVAYEEMVGGSRDRIIGERPAFLGFGSQADTIRQAVASRGQWRGELLLRDSDGRPRTTRVGISEIRDGDDTQRFLVINLEDISKMREFERRIDFLSYNDDLTGLPNLSALQQWFDDTGPGSPGRNDVAVVYLDLDRFKATNETFGHPIGDQVLIEVGRRLREGCGSQDFVTRLGGDDFVVVLTGITDEAGAMRRAERLVGQLARPIESGNHRIFTSASAGVVIDLAGNTKLEDILRRADAAHAAAKRRGKGQVQIYEDSMQRDVEEQALVETHLREAIRQGELSLVFQPIVELQRGQIVGLEALVRWDNPALGDVPPARFIPVAEESGLIVELGAWIFEQACLVVRDWLDREISFGSLSVNISPAQFQQPAFADELAEALDRHGLNGAHFTIEITENILMTDPERASEVLHRLRDLGCSIAVDDFGTGYSSLAYLRQFPLQGIKLDRAFVGTIPDSAVDSAIVRSVIELSGALGMRLVAEGIETDRQRDALQRWGCRYGQGYLYSKPMPGHEIDRQLEASSGGSGRKGNDFGRGRVS